jgi:hypothetical protein
MKRRQKRHQRYNRRNIQHQQNIQAQSQPLHPLHLHHYPIPFKQKNTILPLQNVAGTTKDAPTALPVISQEKNAYRASAKRVRCQEV